MKQKKVFTGTLLVLTLWISLRGPAFAQDKPDSLDFRIGLEKDTFLVSEPIWLDLYMTNLAGEKVGVKPLTPASDWLKIILINSKNDTIPYNGEVIDWTGGGPTFTVQPKETLYICRNLLEATGFGETEATVMFWRTYLKPDMYRIRAIYRRHFASDELRFMVVNPPAAEKEAHRLWKDGCRNYRKPKWDLSIAAWRELLEKYPKSVYAPSACWELSNIYDVVKGDLEASGSYQKKLLAEYPNSGYCQYSFRPFIRGKTPEEEEKVLTELEKKYAGTRVAKFVNNVRKRIIAY